ncbi:MAG TPA: D-aminoacylase [Longimicrobiales bacterium]|nr:D-aminoacylase [Longimicrobiales bacterium]
MIHLRLLRAGAPAALLALLLAAVPAAAQDYDVLIRNGRVLDGTGNPWFYADVAIRGDRIAAVGDLGSASARRVIDATGLYVAPGFIDTHTHAGGGLASPDLSHGQPLLAQGITTILANPDGGGPVDMAEQRAALVRDGLGVNVGQLVPHGSVRRQVIGMEDRAATAEELERMRGLVRRGMEEGAFGLSSGLYYAPGSYAPLEEVIELGKVVAPFGGAYQSHIRDEADYNIGVVAAVDEVIDVARGAAIPGVVTHVKALGPRVWGFSQAIVHRIERAREEGLEVYADQYPYEASGTGITGALVPRWAQVGGNGELVRRIDDPVEGPRLRADILDNFDRRGGAARLQFQGGGPGVQGRSIQEVADERGVTPLELVLSILREGGSGGLVSFNMHENDIRTLMVQPWTITASDGSLPRMGQGVPHPRAYGSFPRKLRRYVLDDEVVDLAHAVRSMTSLPAGVYRVADRGLLHPGAYADVVVFDPETVTDKATYQEPHQLAEGMVHVLVNGRAAIDGGRFTTELHGRVLSRKEAPAGTPATSP